MGQLITSITDPDTPISESLATDLGRLINDDRFYDIILKCSDGRNVFGCKAILATRSKLFNELIFTGSAIKNLTFDNINSNAMKVILEYLYTDMVKKENLTVDNVIEVYHASIHFNFEALQLYIMARAHIFLNDGNEDVGKKLLSECVNKFSLTVDNPMSEMLVKWVAKDK